MHFFWVAFSLLVVFGCVRLIEKKLGAPEVEGQLQSGRTLKLMGMFSFLLVAFLAAIVTIQSPFEDFSELWAFAGLFALFVPLTAYFIGEGFLVKGHYNAESIEFYTPWAGKKSEKLSDIESVANKGYTGVAIKFTTGTEMVVPARIKGFRGLINHLHELGYNF